MFLMELKNNFLDKIVKPIKHAYSTPAHLVLELLG